jgi:hypothetical protein
VVGAISVASGHRGDPTIAMLLAVGGAGDISGLQAASRLATTKIADPVISITEDI